MGDAVLLAEAYGLALAAILGLMIILWLISLLLKNSSIVDIFWGTGFVISNWVYFVLAPLWAAWVGIDLLRREVGQGEREERER